MQGQDTAKDRVHEDIIALEDVFTALGMSELQTSLQQADNLDRQQHEEHVLSPNANVDAACVPYKRQRTMQPYSDRYTDRIVQVDSAGPVVQSEDSHGRQQLLQETAQDRDAVSALGPLENAAKDVIHYHTPVVDTAHVSVPAKPTGIGCHTTPMHDPAKRAKQQGFYSPGMPLHVHVAAGHEYTAYINPTTLIPGPQLCSSPGADSREATARQEATAAGVNPAGQCLGERSNSANVRPVQNYCPEVGTLHDSFHSQERLGSDGRDEGYSMKSKRAVNEHNCNSGALLLTERVELGAQMCQHTTQHQPGSLAATVHISTHTLHQPVMEDERIYEASMLQDWKDIGLDDGGDDWGQERIAEGVDTECPHAQHHNEQVDLSPEDMHVKSCTQLDFAKDIIESKTSCYEPFAHGAVIFDTDEENAVTDDPPCAEPTLDQSASFSEHQAAAHTARTAKGAGAELRKPLLFRSKPANKAPLSADQAQEQVIEAVAPAAGVAASRMAYEQQVVRLRTASSFQFLCSRFPSWFKQCHSEGEQ